MEQASLIVAVIAALSGVLVGGGGVFVVLSRANQSKDLKDSTEKLLASLIPESTLQEVSILAHRAFDLVEAQGAKFQQAILDSAEFIETVTDGKPNEASS